MKEEPGVRGVQAPPQPRKLRQPRGVQAPPQPRKPREPLEARKRREPREPSREVREPHARRALPDVLQFMQLLWAVAHGLERASKRMKGKMGVTGPQRLVLRVVGLFPGLSAGELAAVLHLHPSTLTGVLRRLQAQELLQRTPDDRDRRRAVLRLTSRGARVNGVRRGTVESAVAEVLGGVGARERDSAMSALRLLALRLNERA